MRDFVVDAFLGKLWEQTALQHGINVLNVHDHAGFWINVAGNGDFQHVVMSVVVFGTPTLEELSVFLFREVVEPESMTATKRYFSGH